MAHNTLGYKVPQQQTIQDTFRFLLWNQFPVILESAVRYHATLPKVGVYNRHVRPTIKSFMAALHENAGRQLTLSGVGSLIDYEKYGHQIKRPSPQLAGTGCEGNSLCLEPECFGFVEGVYETNNLIQDICWSLAMPCLKDMLYSDTRFDEKMESYFAMFFRQPAAVLTSYLRTRFLKESIKVVASGTNVTFTGPLIGGTAPLSLPFWMDPTDPTAFPLVASVPGGVGGVNLDAFFKYLAPRLFNGAFDGGVENVMWYGLSQDYETAKQQTNSVLDSFFSSEVARLLSNMSREKGLDAISSIMGNFEVDPLFPTFQSVGGTFTPVTAETLEASTIAGYLQTYNPEHNLAPYRALLGIPKNWMHTLVEPPEDDFSYLGLEGALNFRLNTPGVFPVMSTSMFAKNKLARDGVFELGEMVGPNGMVMQTARGIEARDRVLQEAIRSEVFLTYSQLGCTAAEGQLANVAQRQAPQARADGFSLKSTMYVGSEVVGQAKPVLLLFATDTPRSALPIVVCTTQNVVVDSEAGATLVNCCPGNQNYAVLTFSRDVSDIYTVNDQAVYRTGAKGESFLVTITAVAGTVVTIQSAYEDTIIPCCTGSPDDYGTRGELLVCTGATANCSEIMKGGWDTYTESLFLELFFPIAPALADAAVTITLECGTVIEGTLVADSDCVFVEIVPAVGETFDFSTLDCNCLLNAEFCVTLIT